MFGMGAAAQQSSALEIQQDALHRLRSDERQTRQLRIGNTRIGRDRRDNRKLRRGEPQWAQVGVDARPEAVLSTLQQKSQRRHFRFFA